MTSPRDPIVVVTDAGVDDAFALATLAGCGVPIRAVVATAGNAPLQTSIEITAGVLALLGLDVPLLAGTDKSLSGPYPEAEGGSVPSVRESRAVEALDPALLGGSVLAGTPLTLVAAALAGGVHPRSLTWMGGCLDCPGNVTNTAEFNAWLDPEAADRVLSSDLRVVMVPLDVTTRIVLGLDHVRALAVEGGGATARALAHEAATVIGEAGQFVPHDAVAALAHVEPELFQWRAERIRCDLTDGEQRGHMVRSTGDEQPANVWVATDVDAGAAIARIVEAVRRCR